MSMKQSLFILGVIQEEGMQIGDKIEFSGYDWRVLDIKDNAALIITEDIVELRAYHNKPGDITWADCELRKYLNGEFLERFINADKDKIIPTTIVNSNNPWFGTIGGEDTNDKVFLLSIEEVVCKYFGDSSENLLRVPNGKYKYWFTKKDNNNAKRISSYLGYIWWWWLRSPGRKQVKAVYIHGDGNIGIQGNSALKCNLSDVIHPVNNDLRGGICPALWLKL